MIRNTRNNNTDSVLTMRSTRNNNINTNNNTGSVISLAGWKSYNNRNARSYGYEYREDPTCGNVYVRNSKYRQRFWSFPTHPSPRMFDIMENYPTLVGLDNDKLMELVDLNDALEADLSKSSESIEELKNSMKTVMLNHTTQMEQQRQEQLQRVEQQEQLQRVEQQQRQQLEQVENELQEHQCQLQQQKIDHQEEISRAQAEITRQKQKVDAEKELVKEMHLCELDEMKTEKQLMTQKMKEMEVQMKELKKTSERYQNSCTENMHLVNLTVSALNTLHSLPSSILNLQKQIDFINKPYDLLVAE